MKQNMNMVDRFVRLFIAVLFGFFCWVSHFTGAWAIAFFAIALFLAVTAIIGVCPFYLLVSPVHKTPGNAAADSR
ncbi:MAG TPA: DUF2892 domain-containing protein [Flavisolibacter sp.]|nr:DUF2892 domain-containing protein [Flavisolibacter sp.]